MNNCETILQSISNFCFAGKTSKINRRVDLCKTPTSLGEGFPKTDTFPRPSLGLGSDLAIVGY